MRINRVSYGTTTIQQLRRVALDQNLLETLGLGVGDHVRVELDVDSGTVLISKAAPPPIAPEHPKDKQRSKRVAR